MSTRMSTSPTQHLGRRSLALLFALLLAPCALVQAQAQSQSQAYPSKPIRIVFPFAAGGAGDSSIRLIARHLALALEQTVIVENKPGANGVIGMMEVARAAPDGYTLVYGSTTSMAANVSLMKKLPYDPVKDFAPITRIGLLPFMLVSTTTLPFTTVKELVQYAKANPGKVSFANHSAPGHVAGVMLAQMAGIELLRVPYKASSTALTEMVGGDVSIMFIDIAPALPLVKAGRIRALGMATAQRSPLLPELPTVGEGLGMPGFELVPWTGVAAPAGTPAAIVQRLNIELGRIVSRPDVKDELARMFIDAAPSTPEQMAEWIKTDIDKWGRLIKAAGIEAQ